MKPLIMLLLITVTSQVRAFESVDITDPVQISSLHQLQQSIDSISATVMKCMGSGSEHKSCLCKNKDLIIQFNGNVKRLFLEHPGLKKHDLVTFKTPGGEWISQSLKGIQTQASVTPACD